MVARPKNNADDNLERSIFDKTNLTNFSDAIIGITITLLVLELRFPEIEEQMVDTMFVTVMIGAIPTVVGYIIGFMVISSF
jgi:uncharacterized membrane protein